MLSALSEAASLIQPPPDLDSLTFDDPAVYEMIGQADTVGVFQVESRAQAQMLPQFKPRCFNDLIIAISLIRPGPIQGNMVHPFLRRRLGIEPVSYAHPSLEPALKETLGVILFQEQVLKVARDLAGFTAGQGELLRRALGAKDATGEIERLRGMFLAGAAAQGVPEETAITVFEQLKAFGSYSFAKSHAAAFAVIVYQSAWLKRYHLPAFFVALLNNQPMGFWNAAVLVSEAKRQGLTMLPVDVHHSQGNCTVEAGGIRLGLGMVKGMGERATDLILSQRARQPFAHLAGFCQRTRLPRSLVERLIAAGAMDSWGTPRRHLLWELGTLDYEVRRLDLTYPVEDVELAQLTPVEAMHLEQSVQGLSAGPHVMTLYRRYLEERNIWGSRKLANSQDGQRVRVAGLLVVHQSPPTAKGFHFLTLEDEDGMMNIIVRPKVYDEHRVVIRTARLLLVLDDCQREGHVINVLARRLFALPALS
jgi:error-prone DNA polymerase